MPGASRVAPAPDFDGLDEQATAADEPSRPGQRRGRQAPSVLRRLDMIESELDGSREARAKDELNLESWKTIPEGYKSSPLHAAACGGDVTRTAVLLGHNDGPQRQVALTQRDEAGWLPLHYAACAGRRYSFRVPLGPQAPVGTHDLCKNVLGSVVDMLGCVTKQHEDEALEAEMLAQTEAKRKEAEAAEKAKLLSDGYGELLDDCFFERDMTKARNLAPRMRRAPQLPAPADHRAAPEAPDLTREYTMIFKEVSAQRVPKADAGGRSDPYARFTLLELPEGSHQSGRTQPAFNETNPTWAHKVQFTLPAGSPAALTRKPLVRVTVYDKDLTTEDDALGEATVRLDLSRAPFNVPQPQRTVTLKGKEGFEDFPITFGYALSDIVPGPARLTLSHIRAHGVPDADSQSGSGRSDPFILFKLLEVTAPPPTHPSSLVARALSLSLVVT